MKIPSKISELKLEIMDWDRAREESSELIRSLELRLKGAKILFKQAVSELKKRGFDFNPK